MDLDRENLATNDHNAQIACLLNPLLKTMHGRLDTTQPAKMFRAHLIRVYKTRLARCDVTLRESYLAFPDRLAYHPALKFLEECVSSRGIIRQNRLRYTQVERSGGSKLRGFELSSTNMLRPAYPKRLRSIWRTKEQAQKAVVSFLI